MRIRRFGGWIWCGNEPSSRRRRNDVHAVTNLAEEFADAGDFGDLSLVDVYAGHGEHDADGVGAIKAEPIGGAELVVVGGIILDQVAVEEGLDARFADFEQEDVVCAGFEHVLLPALAGVLAQVFFVGGHFEPGAGVVVLTDMPVIFMAAGGKKNWRLARMICGGVKAI